MHNIATLDHPPPHSKPRQRPYTSPLRYRRNDHNPRRSAPDPPPQTEKRINNLAPHPPAPRPPNPPPAGRAAPRLPHTAHTPPLSRRWEMAWLSLQAAQMGNSIRCGRVVTWDTGGFLPLRYCQVASAIWSGLRMGMRTVGTGMLGFGGG